MDNPHGAGTGKAAAHRRYSDPKVRASQAAHRERSRAAIREYLVEHPCVDCGEADPIVLEFDHVRGDKAFDLSHVGHRSIARIMAEIEKCDVRCANCHRRRHHPGSR